MWSPNEQGKSGTEVVVIADMPPPELVARTAPVVSNMNITKSSRVHIGPKFVTQVTQNVENAELVKGRILGLELVAPAKSNGLRCSVAVFVCWALVVAAGLGLYLFQLATRPVRLDLAYPCPLYVWTVVRNTTRAERMSCALAALALVLCTALILHFTLVARRGENNVDRAPHEWNITREDWLARQPTGNTTVARFAPLKLVVVQHTVSPECHRFTNCAAELRNLQNYFLDSKQLGYDIPYNFLIGNDGRVYQGRGWNREGAHTSGFNRCSLGVAFIGDYREELPIHSCVTGLQLQRFTMLLEDGVALGFLRPDYSILPAKDVQASASPGSNLYRALQQLDHYERTYSFRQMKCEDIYDKLGLPYEL